MAWSENEVIAALAHAEMAVRDRALETLGNAYPHSTAAMPAIIQAIDQYGWDDAFSSLFHAQFLPQSRETIAWAWDNLSKGIAAAPAEEPWYCYDLACIIAYAEPSARNREAEQKYQSKLREGLAVVLTRPLDLNDLSDDELWQRFEADTKRWDAAPQELSRIELIQMGIALGSRGESLAPKLMECLQETESADTSPRTNTRIRIAAIALGVARHKPAIEVLFDQLHAEDIVQGLSVAELSLAKIGGEEVVDSLKKRLSDNEFLLEFGGRLFGVIPSEKSLVAGLETLKQLHGEVAKQSQEEADLSGVADLAADLADGLLFHFDARAVAPAAELARLLKEKDRRDTLLESAVGIAAELLDIELAERKEWYYFASEEAREARSRPVEQNLLSPDGNVIYEGFDPNNLPHTPSISVNPLQVPRRRRRLTVMRPTPDPESRNDRRLIPIRRPDAPIGRNDPCPCGSGKKYKNCCFRKD